MQQCAGTVKRLSLELGEHAPFIVFGDAGREGGKYGIEAFLEIKYPCLGGVQGPAF